MFYKIILISMFSFIMGEDFYNPDGRPFTLSITTNIYYEKDIFNFFFYNYNINFYRDVPSY